MNTIGWLLILAGLYLLLGVTKGRRLTDAPKDLGDIARAIATGASDPAEGAKQLKEVLARTGTTHDLVAVGQTTSGTNGTTSGTNTGSTGTQTGTELLTVAQRLASAAGNRYVWGAEGPSAYDCSGLIWAAMKQTGVYTGSRFTTYSFVSAMGDRIKKVDTPTVGDIVLWSSHMGIIDGDGTMFSALNAKDGIMHSPLSYGPKGETPTYYRIVSGSTL